MKKGIGDEGMALAADLMTLASYLAGEFENREQAQAEPIWFVPLRLWQRPVPLFAEDSVTLFAEQANQMTLDNPYRQRLMRLMRSPAQPHMLQVQYYSFQNPDRVKGAGQHPEILATVTPDDIDLLPGCRLEVTASDNGTLQFVAKPPADARCFFDYEGKQREVVLGFEVSAETYLTYDKGVDPETGKGLWGALMGPYRHRKIHSYALS